MTGRLLVWAGVEVVLRVVQCSLLRMGVHLKIFELDLINTLGFCDIDHLITDLLLEETQNSLWRHHSLVVLRILELAESVIIKNDRHNPLGHRGDVLVLTRLADVHLGLENPLDTDSIVKHDVEVGNLILELRCSLLILRSSCWDLVEQLLHKSTDDHTLLLGKLILDSTFRIVGTRCGEITKSVDHVHNSHHLNQNLIVNLVSFFTDGVTFSGVKLLLVLGINNWEVG